jgi:hypothetical protein
MSDFHVCRVCGSRWMTSSFQNLVGGGMPTDYGLCTPCNEAARMAVSAQTPAMAEEQRRKRIAHFGNDGTPPKKLHREMAEGDL